MLPATISLNLFILVVASVAALMLLAGASLRPMLEKQVDKAGRRLRIEVHDDRKIIIYVPEGVSIRWQGKDLDRVVQHEILLENNTRELFSNLKLRIRLEPFNTQLTDDMRVMGIIIPPTPHAAALVLPQSTPGERVVEVEYLEAMSQIILLVFAQVDGDLAFDTLCDREIIVRHTGNLFSENVEKVLPAWVLWFRPILWPLTLVAMLRTWIMRRGLK